MSNSLIWFRSSERCLSSLESSSSLVLSAAYEMNLQKCYFLYLSLPVEVPAISSPLGSGSSLRSARLPIRPSWRGWTRRPPSNSSRPSWASMSPQMSRKRTMERHSLEVRPRLLAQRLQLNTFFRPNGPQLRSEWLLQAL